MDVGGRQGQATTKAEPVQCGTGMAVEIALRALQQLDCLAAAAGVCMFDYCDVTRVHVADFIRLAAAVGADYSRLFPS